MQKIDFVENITDLVDKLKSKEIVALFHTGFSNPGELYNFAPINQYLFMSKSNYDQIKSDDRFSEILTTLKVDKLYEEANLSRLTTFFRNTKTHEILTPRITVEFYNFHSTLLQTAVLSKTILEDEIIADSLKDNVNNGVIVFQVLINGKGLATEQYIKIFIAINELIEVLSKIVDEDDQKSEIVLLDSGSDTNVGIRSGIETTKSLFLIFKEIWDFITNFKYYKQQQRNKALLDSLTIRSQIQEKIDSGVLTEAEGKEYTHMIKTRTDDLIGMKVLPKKIVNEATLIENKNLLEEFEGSKLLSSGDKSKRN